MKRSGSVLKNPRPARRRLNLQSGVQAQRNLRPARYILIRYRFDNAISSAFSPFTLIQGAGCFSINTTQAKAIGESLRIHHVKLIGAPPSAGSATEVAVEFRSGDQHAPAQPFTNSSNNTNVNPTVYVKPPKFSDSADWQLGTKTDQLLYVAGPTNTIMEIGMWVRNHANGGAGTTFVTPSTVNADYVYYFPPNANITIIQ